MTKTEYGKCVKLMEKAINKAKQSDEEYKVCIQLFKKGKVGAGTELRKADQHYSEAVGIEQTLIALGFKHDRMKELAELL